ncbi:MAG: hypothetical protein ACTSXV_00400 [Alphaproteobacteria bacterium]
MFFPILAVVFFAIRSTHTHSFSVMKTMVIGLGGFFFYLIALLPFFTGGIGILIAVIGILHRHVRPSEEIFRTEYQVALALLLTLWGQQVGYAVLFLFLLPELIDLLTETAGRIFKVKPKKTQYLCHLNDMHDPLFKSRVGLHVILVFLSGGMIGFSNQPIAVFILAVLATLTLFLSKNLSEPKKKLQKKS